MVASFTGNSINFTWKLYSLLMCACAFMLNGENSNLIPRPVSDLGTIDLKKLNELEHDPKNAKQYILDRIRESNSLRFLLYPNFTFNSELFKEILRTSNPGIIIRFNDELQELVRLRKVKSSEYVDKFLANFLNKKNLERLDLSSLYLTEVPKMIREFKYLEILDLGYNELDSLNLECDSLKSLKFLYLGLGRNVNEIDESIFSLPSLITLRINNCPVTEVPETINKLKKLEDFEISGLNLKKFPKSFNLKKIKFLDFSNCGFVEFYINLYHHPDLASLLLRFNHSLKYLELVIIEIPQKLHYFDVTGCPLDEVKIMLNLNNTKFNVLNRNNQQLEYVDYAIKLCAEELFCLPQNHGTSNSKLYEFNISTGTGFIKTILIKKFDKEKIKTLSRFNLVDKWIGICKDFNMESEAELHDEYNHSIEFLKNLSEIDNIDFSDWSSAFPLEYKEKISLILSELFNQLENESSESRIKSFLKIFKRPISEQLIYYNYLLNYNKLCSREKDCFNDFIGESIGILKDLALTIFLNSEKYERGLNLNSLISDRDGYQNVLRETDKSEVYRELLMAIIGAKNNFDSKFTVEYFSEIIGNVVARIDDPQLFNYDKMVESLLGIGGIGSECFDHETQNDTDIIKKPNSKGMKVFISLILNRQILSLNE